MKVAMLRMKKDGEEIFPDSLDLVVGVGARGDEKALKKGDAKIIIADEAELVRYRDENKGLCVGRFRPHISTEGLSYSEISVGTVIAVGDAKLEITGMSKKCFPECDFVKTGTVCCIKYNCASAKVIESGTVVPNSPVYIVK